MPAFDAFADADLVAPSCGSAAPDAGLGAPAGLSPDAGEIGRFLDALFRHADPGTFVSLRAFDQVDRACPPVLIEGVEIVGPDLGTVVARATAAAGKAANARTPAVFAPPVATFHDARRARSIDVANGLTLSVEIDEGDARAAWGRLAYLLGPATCVVASGGEWADPVTGELLPKLHLHWRLAEPTRTAADHDKLREARWLAAILVGADRTAAPPAHPLRWPGSWNCKRAPRLARIADLKPDAEIHLEDALDRLAEAVEGAGLRRQDAGPHVAGEASAAIGDLAEALAAIPNSGAVHWDDWNRLGMAAYRATGGGTAGLDAWAAWSAKSPKHAGQACADRWQHFGISPPTKIGAGTIFHLAAAAGWRRARREDPPPHEEIPEHHRGGPEPEEEPRPEDYGEAPPPKEKPTRFGRLRLLSVEDALDAPPRDYLLDGLIAPGEFSVWWGPPKCGKSFLLLRIAYGMAQGLGMWGREAVPVPVCYVAAEGGNGIKGRIHALRKRLGPAPGFHFIAQLVDLFAPDADLDDLIAAIAAFGSRFVVLDTLARVMGAGDENATRDMNAFVRNCQRIQEETGAHVAVIHHGGWDGAHARGSIALIGAADIVVKVSGEQGGPKAALVEYAKDDESGFSLGFNLAEEELPPDAKGRPRKTYVAEETEAPPAQAKPLRLHDEAVSLLRHIETSLASGHGGAAQPAPGMPLVPTLSRKLLHLFLLQRGWLRLPAKLPDAESNEGSVTDAEWKRLYQRLTALQNKGLVGFNRKDVWLVKAAQSS